MDRRLLLVDRFARVPSVVGSRAIPGPDLLDRRESFLDRFLPSRLVGYPAAIFGGTMVVLILRAWPKGLPIPCVRTECEPSRELAGSSRGDLGRRCSVARLVVGENRLGSGRRSARPRVGDPGVLPLRRSIRSRAGRRTSGPPARRLHAAEPISGGRRRTAGLLVASGFGGPSGVSQERAQDIVVETAARAGSRRPRAVLVGDSRCLGTRYRSDPRWKIDSRFDRGWGSAIGGRDSKAPAAMCSEFVARPAPRSRRGKRRSFFPSTQCLPLA